MRQHVLERCKSGIWLEPDVGAPAFREAWLGTVTSRRQIELFRYTCCREKAPAHDLGCTENGQQRLAVFIEEFPEAVLDVADFALTPHFADVGQNRQLPIIAKHKNHASHLGPMTRNSSPLGKKGGVPRPYQ